MKQFKLTRVYIVPANSKQEARDQLNDQVKRGLATEFLEFESIREVAEPNAGMVQTALKQLGFK